MTDEELLYTLALYQTPNIGDVQAGILLQHFQTPKEIFKASISKLERIEGVGRIRAHSIKTFNDFGKCEKEICFIRKEKIKVLCRNKPEYPKRLLHCHDAPFLLFYKGNADMNEERFISIVGTRDNTAYGKAFCDYLVRELSSFGVTIVSGLAYGIDSIIHSNCVRLNIPTIGVLAHGLDRIYPGVNRKLAEEMLQNGGLISPFCSGTIPDRQNFPSRNRVTAGLCDALIVIETGMKGGSLITAKLASDYHKEIFALPGRYNEEKSSGCNHLIKTNQAGVITSVDDIIEGLCWKKKEQQQNKNTLQTSLFPKLNPNETKLVDILVQQKTADIDSLMFLSNLTYGAIATALLTLEMNGIVRPLPGKTYTLVS